MSDATQDPRQTLQIGQTIGSYRLLGKLGEGGVGVVFEARHERLSRRAAIKVLRPEYSQNPDMVRRFFNEAESVNLVQHPGIVNIFEFGQLPDQTAFIVMEYLDGDTLRGRLKRQGGKLGLPGVRLIRQVASALAAAHARGIIHRDLKPENVMIVQDPDVPGGERTKLLDFGIAKVTAEQQATGVDMLRTQAGQVMGTPAYMSPEQLRDTGGVNDRADVYSLGVMLYEVLAGRLPFVANSMAELVGMHIFAQPQPLAELDPSLPAKLCRLVDAMLAKEAAPRPSMIQVQAALEGAGAQTTATVVTGAAVRPVAPPQPRRIWPLLLLGGAVVFGGIGGAAYRITHRPPPPSIAAPPPVEAKAPPAPVDLAALWQQAMEVVREGLRAPDAAMRRRAAALLGQSRDGRTGALLLPLLADSEPAVQAAAVVALRQLGARAATQALLQLLKERGAADEVRAEAAGTLLQLGDPSGERLLEKAMRGKDLGLRERAALLLSERGDRRAREQVLRAGTIDDEHVAALGRLARSGDREAKDALRLALGGSGGAPSDLSLRAAEELARDDDRDARALLEGLAGKQGALSMRAARLLASLDDPAYYDRFVRCFPDASCPLPDRMLSAEGLGAYGRKDGAPILQPALPADPGRTLRLRLSAAGALLQIAARDPAQLASLSLSEVKADLGAGERPQRELAAEALGDAEPKVAVPLLRGAMKDQEPEVRRSAALALGRTQARDAVPVLGEALDDSAGVVRTEAMNSLGRVGEHLRKRGEPVEDMVKTVSVHAGKGDPSERLAGVAALVRLGSSERRDELRQWLRSGDADLRRQAIEAWSADPGDDAEVLVGAIGDRSSAVRFAAAVALAQRGRREGVPVLLQALGSAGASAVVARGMLRRLGLATPGEVVLGTGPESERAAMVSAAAYLPSGEALSLLRRAAHDVAARVRLRVLAVLGDLPELARTALGRQLLGLLLADRDPLVRGRAGLLSGRLGLKPEDRPEPAKQPEVTADAGAEPDLQAPDLQVAPDLQGGDVQAAPQRGHLEIEAEPEVRFQVDRRPQQAAPVKPIALSPGKHRVSYAGGAVDVEVPAGGTASVRVPVTQGDQVLGDAVEAFAAGDLDRAQQLLGRAQAALGRGGATKEKWFNVLYHQGRVQEAQGRWLEAMNAYEKLAQKVPERDRSAAQRAQMAEAVGRAAGKLGRIRVGKEVDGKCQTTELWMLPGTHVLDVGGNSQEVRVRAGETIKVQACE